MGGVCRRQGEHACGIVYTLSRDDSEVVAAYLRVPTTPIWDRKLRVS